MRSGVAPFYVMEMMRVAEQRVAAGLPIHNLAAGQPSTTAPAPVLAAAHRALDDNAIGYTAALGIAPLREAVAAHVQRWYGIDVPTDNVVITTGSSGGFMLSFLAAFDAGDVVAMARPGYPAYRNILASLDCTVLEFDCGAECGYVPTVAMLEALSPKPKGLILASPANPRLAEIVDWCDRNDVLLISDEIYHGITYGLRGASAWEYSRAPIVVNSFSKYFSMTGWRLGWLLVPDSLLGAVDTLAGNYAICPPALSQLAGIAAFDAYDELDANVAR
jgi:aspartate/methionine/tyrosine aminotransferase